MSVESALREQGKAGKDRADERRTKRLGAEDENERRELPTLRRKGPGNGFVVSQLASFSGAQMMTVILP